MTMRSVPPLVVLTVLTAAAASQASPFRPLPSDAARKEPAPVTSERTTSGKPVSGLPYARGRTFATLDDYLAFRRQQGAIDLPWYKEVSPGLFELQTSMRPAPPPERLTRAELARKFGFER